jgi:phosphotransferase system HPr-like phosphotransfer protein
MKVMTVRIRGVADAATLVEHAKEINTDVTIRHGKFCIDGKSILGVLSLDMSDGVQVEYDENETEFENWLRRFKV